MAVKTTSRKTLTWDETTPGEWKWLTFGQLCDIADQGRAEGVDETCFVYFHPEYACDDKQLRADAVLIDDAREPA